MTTSALLKHPSAFLPIAMSITALAMVLVTLALVGITHEEDEGTLAHIFQLLIVAQVPIVAFFAIKWLPKNPKQALLVLSMQAAAGVAALAPVFLLGL
jgi:hypothetical membrane protein